MADRFQFFYRSADKRPGLGVGERAVGAYPILERTPHWRRVLSSLNCDCPFVHEGVTYRSVEHALQGAKFMQWYPEVAREFSVESGHPIGIGDGLGAMRARKRVMLSPAQLADWEARRHETKVRIYLSKFGPPGIAHDILLGTGSAELWSAGPRIATLRATTLEDIRTILLAPLIPRG